MNVRQIDRVDIDSCAGLFSDVFNERPWNESWSRNEALERLTHIYESKGFLGFVAESENTVVGFVLGNIEPYTGGGAFYLREICVKTNEQGKGIGKRLVSNLHSELLSKNVSRSYLITRLNSQSAAFYIANGYILEEAEGVYGITINS